MPQLKLPTQGLFQDDYKYKTELFNFLNTHAISIYSTFTHGNDSGNYTYRPDTLSCTIEFNKEIVIPKGFSDDTKDSSKALKTFTFLVFASFDYHNTPQMEPNMPKSFYKFLNTILILFPQLKEREQNTKYLFPMGKNSITPHSQEIAPKTEQKYLFTIPSTYRNAAALPTPPPPTPSNLPLETINEQCMCPCDCNSPGARQMGGKRKTIRRSLKSRRKTRRYRHGGR